MRKYLIVLGGALLLASAGAAFAQSEPGGHPGFGAGSFRPSPIDPGLTPHSGGGQPMSGLDQQKLDVYRDELDSRMLDNRLSGRDLTPGGARETRGLDAELGRVNGALGR
jgi:hypothetical protein